MNNKCLTCGKMVEGFALYCLTCEVTYQKDWKQYKKFEEESIAESNMDTWNWNKAQELIETYLALKKNQEWGVLPQSKDTLEDELQAMQNYKAAMEAYQKAGGYTTVEVIEDPTIPVPSLIEEPKKRKINFDD